VTLGFRAAAKMLRPLPVGHPLRRKLEDPEGLARLRDEQPAELLRAVLESAEKPLSGAEIRDALAGIVSEAQWPSWWAAARRHPQLVALGSGRQSYRWESSASGALDAVRRSFDRADPRRKMDIFRKNAERDPELAANFAGDLASIASEAAAGDPGLAWEIFFLLERAGRLPKPLAGLVDVLLGGKADPRPLLASIEDRLLRERALTMVRERREDWKQIYRDWLGREEDPRVLSLLAQSLAEADVAAHERWIDDLIAQPRRAPAAFTWIAERAADDELLRARAPLRLLQQILATATAEEFSGYRARLRALLDEAIADQVLQPALVYGYYPCNSDGNDLVVWREDGSEWVRFSFPRQRRDRRLCIADYFRPVTSGDVDVVAFHVVTMGRAASEATAKLFDANRYREYLELHGITVEMAEALAEYWHQRIRQELRIADQDADQMEALFDLGYRGARYSFGYPACPDLEQQSKIFELLDPGRIGVELSEEYQLHPEQSTSAVIVHHPEAMYFNAR
jgi:hypothetical protein